MTTIDLGSFKVTNHHILVTDPCYTEGDGQVSVGDCVNGEWEVWANSRLALPEWGPAGHERVMELTATAKGVDLDDLTELDSVYYADVDSGCMGIFNFDQYLPGQGGLRERSLDVAGTGEAGANVGFGAFSSAGYGDGTYPVTLYINESGLISGITVSFGLPADEEDEDE
jgi:hypothetical protein